MICHYFVTYCYNLETFLVVLQVSCSLKSLHSSFFLYFLGLNLSSTLCSTVISLLFYSLNIFSFLLTHIPLLFHPCYPALSPLILPSSLRPYFPTPPPFPCSPPLPSPLSPFLLFSSIYFLLSQSYCMLSRILFK